MPQYGNLKRFQKAVSEIGFFMYNETLLNFMLFQLEPQNDPVPV